MFAEAIMGELRELGLSVHIPQTMAYNRTTMEVWNPELNDRQILIHFYDDEAGIMLCRDNSGDEIGLVDELTEFVMLNNHDRRTLTIPYSDPRFLDELYKMLEPLHGKTHC